MRLVLVKTIKIDVDMRVRDVSFIMRYFCYTVQYFIQFLKSGLTDYEGADDCFRLGFDSDLVHG